jgi:uncharacterized membrane protein
MIPDFTSFNPRYAREIPEAGDAMQTSQFHYLPLTPGFFSILVVLFFVLLILIQLRVLRYAYMQLGLSSRGAMLLLFGSLAGSYFNIPIAEIPGAPVATGGIVDLFGMRYQVPVISNYAGTLLAVNVGGAVIPVAMSVYLLVRYQLWIKAVAATAIVAAIVFWFSTPVPGMGIAVPVLLPALVTAIAAFVLERARAAPLAYIAGSLGTLIGADLLNLGRITSLGAPIASIGGAGTFDGIFMTGIVAVLLASLTSPRTEADGKG